MPKFPIQIPDKAYLRYCSSHDDTRELCSGCSRADKVRSCKEHWTSTGMYLKRGIHICSAGSIGCKVYNPIEHYETIGAARGYPMHLGDKVAKVFLGTRNDEHVLKPWVLHHGAIFGFTNLIILDRSSDPRCRKFLELMRKFGVTILYSTAHKEAADESERSNILQSLAYATDFVFPMDTDEFLAFDVRDGEVSFNPRDVIGSLNRFNNSGAKCRLRSSYEILPERNCHAITGHFFRNGQKFFASGWNFVQAPWGVHAINIKPPHDQKPEALSELLYIHLGYLCYSRMVERAKTMLISQGEFSANASDAEILRRSVQMSEGLPTKCNYRNCHKALFLRRDLEDRKGAIEGFKKEREQLLKNSVVLKPFADWFNGFAPL
eukprot:GGOE01063208.1.p1 GENE.GGOE01063208.1~~GGOE01063208.1.p1  ORF type:complete len:436 (+),score=84.45 GGOE01063208.1:175-1308(+)